MSASPEFVPHRAQVPFLIRQRSFAVEEMSPELDALSLQFAIWARQAKRPALDVGCGDGLATVAALARGGRVLAIDPDPSLLGRLLTRVPLEQQQRINVRVGSLPNIDFEFASFAAVHAARVLHYLDGPALEQSLRKFFRWLYPLGKLFVSVLTPTGSYWEPFQAEIRRRTAAGSRWPGLMGDCDLVTVGHPAVAPIHLLDELTLRRELEAAGFVIEELGCYALPWDRQQICCAIIARCNA